MRAIVYSIAVLATCFGCGKSDSAGSAPPAGGPPPARVRVAVAEAGDLATVASYLGRAESSMATPLAAAVAGRVRSVEVREGQSAKRGQLLVALDSRSVRARVMAAESVVKRTEAQLAQARRQADRIKETKAALSAPERERFLLEVDTLSAQLAGDQAELQRVRVELADHRITAPFDGVVAARHVDPGAWVNPGDAVVDLVAAADVQVMLDVPFEVGRQVEVGLEAELQSSAGKAAAVVVGVVPALDESSRMMRLRLEPKERPEWLMPGLPVDVQLPIEVEGEGVLVPRDAVVRGPVGDRVVVIRDGVGVPVDIQVVGSSVGKALVRGEGLKPGDKVITRGNERYRPGSPLEIESER